MKFFIRRASDLSYSETPNPQPCKNAIFNDYFKAWVIEINTLEELISFTKDVDSKIVLYNIEPGDYDFTTDRDYSSIDGEILIYDDYIE